MKRKGMGVHAAELRKLGFEHVTPEMAAYMEHRIERRLRQRFGELSRNERRIVKKIPHQRTFLVFGEPNPSVHAHDETGQDWIVRKTIDTSRLVELGFRDITFEAIVNTATVPPLPPEKTN